MIYCVFKNYKVAILGEKKPLRACAHLFWTSKRQYICPENIKVKILCLQDTKIKILALKKEKALILENSNWDANALFLKHRDSLQSSFLVPK